jgi:hypothetical protein
MDRKYLLKRDDPEAFEAALKAPLLKSLFAVLGLEGVILRNLPRRVPTALANIIREHAHITAGLLNGLIKLSTVSS